MSIDIQARAEILERACYEVIDAETLAALRARHDTDEVHEHSLQRVSGVRDATLLRALAQLGVSASTQFAFELVPLIEVAWADGAMQPREREAILRAAGEWGIETECPEGHVLRAWLVERPSQKLLGAWTGYIAALVEHLSAKQRKTLAAQVVERASVVARAAGGFLGLASISAAEENKLDELESAFKFPEQFATVFDADD